jgi:acetyl esterase/lipase
MRPSIFMMLVAALALIGVADDALHPVSVGRAAVAQTNPGREPARVLGDVPYGTDAKQTLDLYLPAQKEFATVVYVYGGGWHSGSGKSSAPVAERLARAGFGCALVTHRLFPPDKFPAPAEDVAAAFAYVKAHAAGHWGDPRRIFLMGHSSGAHLALLVAADPQYLAAHKLTPGDVAGVVGLSTPTDLSPRQDRVGYGDILLKGRGADPFGRDADLMKRASPVRYVTRQLPRTLLVVGDHDLPSLEADAKEFAAAAERAGASATVEIGKDRDHMQNVRKLLDDRDPVLADVLAFLRETAKPG